MEQPPEDPLSAWASIRCCKYGDQVSRMESLPYVQKASGKDLQQETKRQNVARDRLNERTLTDDAPPRPGLDTASERRLAWLVEQARKLAADSVTHRGRREITIKLVAERGQILRDGITVGRQEHPPD